MMKKIKVEYDFISTKDKLPKVDEAVVIAFGDPRHQETRMEYTSLNANLEFRADNGYTFHGVEYWAYKNRK